MYCALVMETGAAGVGGGAPYFAVYSALVMETGVEVLGVGVAGILDAVDGDEEEAGVVGGGTAGGKLTGKGVAGCACDGVEVSSVSI